MLLCLLLWYRCRMIWIYILPCWQMAWEKRDRERERERERQQQKYRCSLNISLFIPICYTSNISFRKCKSEKLLIGTSRNETFFFFFSYLLLYSFDCIVTTMSVIYVSGISFGPVYFAQFLFSSLHFIYSFCIYSLDFILFFS